MNEHEEEAILGAIETRLGEDEFARHERGWRAKAGEDLETLRVAVEKFDFRQGQRHRGPVNNPGGWLHTEYHRLRLAITNCPLPIDGGTGASVEVRRGGRDGR